MISRFAYFSITIILSLLLASPQSSWGLAANNIPLDSAIYSYLEKLAGLGLISSEFRGLRPFSRAEAARLVIEAEETLRDRDDASSFLPRSIIAELRENLPRELSLYREPQKAPWFDVAPLYSARMRYVYVDGLPRRYARPVHDPGGDGVFGIGSGLRPDTIYPNPVQHQGSEGTPMLENSDGIHYHRGSSVELRASGEAYGGRNFSALAEPLAITSPAGDSSRLFFNRLYAKVGGGPLELEVGRDENWFGPGFRGNLTLTNNARNLDLIKLSSPEPINIRYIGDIKYAFLVARLDQTDVAGAVRQPYFMAAKLSVKPTQHMEFGLNLGRQAGGPGVKNGIGETVRGLVGGTDSDNSNSLAGLEARFRLPFLWNTEIYGEFSGEDSAAFWPIVESYVAGIYIPRLTDSGRDDLRFEYFWGNQILYTNGTFPEGYLYHGMPLGHSQGGAAEDFILRYGHWFSARNRAVVDLIHGERGNVGRVPVDWAGNFDWLGSRQAVERRNAVRLQWNLPLYGSTDINLMYGWERIHNANLVPGQDRTNQLFRMDVSYRY